MNAIKNGMGLVVIPADASADAKQSLWKYLLMLPQEQALNKSMRDKYDCETQPVPDVIQHAGAVTRELRTTKNPPCGAGH